MHILATLTRDAGGFVGQAVGLGGATGILFQILDRVTQRLRRGKAPGNVCGLFHHFVGPAGRIEDGVVAGLQPDLAPAFGNALVASGIVQTLTEFLPERDVGGRRSFLDVDEQRMMFPDDFRQGITHRIEKITALGGVALASFSDHGGKRIKPWYNTAMNTWYILPNGNIRHIDGLELQPEKDWFPTEASIVAFTDAQRAAGKSDAEIIRMMMELAVDCEAWVGENLS